jgi:hypothetical protein
VQPVPSSPRGFDGLAAAGFHSWPAQDHSLKACGSAGR